MSLYKIKCLKLPLTSVITPIDDVYPKLEKTLLTKNKYSIEHNISDKETYLNENFYDTYPEIDNVKEKHYIGDISRHRYQKNSYITFKNKTYKLHYDTKKLDSIKYIKNSTKLFGGKITGIKDLSNLGIQKIDELYIYIFLNLFYTRKLKNNIIQLQTMNYTYFETILSNLNLTLTSTELIEINKNELDIIEYIIFLSRNIHLIHIYIDVLMGGIYQKIENVFINLIGDTMKHNINIHPVVDNNMDFHLEKNSRNNKITINYNTNYYCSIKDDSNCNGIKCSKLKKTHKNLECEKMNKDKNYDCVQCIFTTTIQFVLEKNNSAKISIKIEKQDLFSNPTAFVKGKNIIIKRKGTRKRKNIRKKKSKRKKL